MTERIAKKHLQAANRQAAKMRPPTEEEKKEQEDEFFQELMGKCMDLEKDAESISDHIRNASTVEKFSDFTESLENAESELEALLAAVKKILAKKFKPSKVEVEED